MPGLAEKRTTIRRLQAHECRKTPRVGVVMGSASDWPTMKNAVEIPTDSVPPASAPQTSAHGTPERRREHASTAADRGPEVIVAGAGGAAHLPGMLAPWTILPVLGVPVESRTLRGIDSLLSIVQMPAGVAAQALAGGCAVRVADTAEAVALCNRLAPEHLQWNAAGGREPEGLMAYGGLFLGAARRSRRTRRRR